MEELSDASASTDSTIWLLVLAAVLVALPFVMWKAFEEFEESKRKSGKPAAGFTKNAPDLLSALNLKQHSVLGERTKPRDPHGPMLLRPEVEQVAPPPDELTPTCTEAGHLVAAGACPRTVLSKRFCIYTPSSARF